MKKISVVGLGKLGFCSALCFADVGFKVISIDNDIALVNSIRDTNKVHIDEDGLQELYDKNRSRCEITNMPYQAIKNSDITFIIVPTPSDYSDRFSNRYIEEVLSSLGFHLKDKKERHTFVIVSTVMPGSMQKFVKLLEDRSGKKYPDDFGMVYNPEFVAIGSVIKDFKNPDMLLFGGNYYDIGEVANIYLKAVENEPKIAAMSFEEAEITKLSLNTFLTMKISYANMLGDVCDSFNADVDMVSSALGMDSRISPKLLKAGMSFGGTCFPRDVRALQSLVESVGYDYNLSEMIGECNSLKEKYIAMEAIKGYPKAVNIIGAAYKDTTSVVEESPSIKIADYIENAGISVKLFDKRVKSFLRYEISDNFEEAIENGVTIILAYPNISIATEIYNMTLLADYNIKIIDPWRLLVGDYNTDKIKVVSLGARNEA